MSVDTDRWRSTSMRLPPADKTSETEAGEPSQLKYLPLRQRCAVRHFLRQGYRTNLMAAATVVFPDSFSPSKILTPGDSVNSAHAARRNFFILIFQYTYVTRPFLISRAYAYIFARHCRKTTAKRKRGNSPLTLIGACQHG